jgi:hypothetical protein
LSHHALLERFELQYPQIDKASFIERTRDFLLQRSHVNDEAIFYVALEEALVRCIDLLSANQFDIGGNIVLGAEVEHLLGLTDAADAGSGELSPFHQQAEDRDGQRLFRRADQSHGSVPLQQIDIGI